MIISFWLLIRLSSMIIFFSFLFDLEFLLSFLYFTFFSLFSRCQFSFEWLSPCKIYKTFTFNL